MDEMKEAKVSTYSTMSGKQEYIVELFESGKHINDVYVSTKKKAEKVKAKFEKQTYRLLGAHPSKVNKHGILSS